MGRPSLTKTEDSRLRVTRRYKVERADQTDPATLNTVVFDPYLTADVKYTNCLLVRQYTSEASDQKAEVVLTQVFEEISATPVRFGGVDARMADSRAFVDTDVNGAVVSGTRFAREWTVRYIMAGDGTVTDGNWLAVNETKTFGSRTGYLTATSLVLKGVIYSIIARVYNELPSKLVYDRPTRYSFPGTLGISNGVPIGEPGTTRQVAMEIEETYHIGEVSAQALQYEPLRWASGSVDFTTAGNDGSKAFSFSGCIGSLSIAASNVYFAGYLCTTLAGVIESYPATYPSGKKRIASDARPWRGDLWKRTNHYITF